MNNQHQKIWKSVPKILPLIAVFGGSFLLSACTDQVNAVLEGREARAERYHEEGKAVGNACRHAGRAIEDCYTIYSWLPRAGIFEGWREMDKYMRKHSLETVKPTLPPPKDPNAPKEQPTKKKKKKSADKDKTEENNTNATESSPNAINAMDATSANSENKDSQNNKSNSADENLKEIPTVTINPQGDIIIK